MAAVRKTSGSDKPRRPPATTLEGRENQLVVDAIDLAEKQIANGTVSAQVLTHYLKLGTTQYRQERKKMEAEIELLTAKVEDLKSQAGMEELYKNAIEAMGSYQGTRDFDD